MKRTIKYDVVFERASDGTYSAHVPDLPGCVTSGDTLDETKRLIREAIKAHLESQQEHDE